MRPELARVGEEFAEFVEVAGFRDIGVGTEFEGAVNVDAEGRAAEDHGRDDAVLRIFLHPAEDIEAIDPGHCYIQKQNRGERILQSISVLAAALQVADDFLAIRNNARRCFQREIAKGAFEKERVALVVLGDEDVQIAVHQHGYCTLLGKLRNLRGRG